MAFDSPGALFVARFGPPTDGEDVQHYVQFLREESGLGTEPPIDLERVYRRFEVPRPKRVPLPNLQGLLVNPEMGLILINQTDPAMRQRFTEGHELVELLFTALPSGMGWAAREQSGVFKQAAKERLCNEGAAELLMPRSSFAPRVTQQGVAFSTARQLAVEYQVSVTAALVQMARVGPGRHAVVLWRMKNKPSELRTQPSVNQLTLFSDPPPHIHPKKLRVEWSLAGPGAPFIPTDKSVPVDSSMYHAWQSGKFTYGCHALDLGHGQLRGLFRCENQAFEVEDERQVLSLLHLPGDTCEP
jgi:hypothetical protein